MSYEVTRNELFAAIELKTDKLDTLVAPSLKSEFVLLNNEGIKNFILDLGSAKYCDSSGLSAILIANRLCKNADGRLVICNLQDAVRKLISISQLDSVISIASSADDARTLIQQ